jgi:endonuclease-8
VPEGDTIHRTATTLRAVLDGKTVARFDAPRLPRHRPVQGARVTGVEPRGKHLLIRFDNGLTLHTHMRMTGSWHVYKRGERWRRPPWEARVVVEVDDAVAVCFSAPVVELLEEPDERRHGSLAALGPDLCHAGVDLDEVLRRLEDPFYRDEEVGVVLMDQRAASGVGNIYKSETLHACGVNPFLTWESLDLATRRNLYATASRLLRDHLRGGAHSTGRANWAVYRRRGQLCRRCGTPIAMRRQGADARSTYWCETCQPPR